MSVEDNFNCNSKRLCGAVKSMLSLSSMNDAMWIMARETPDQFLEFVETHLVEIQSEFESHFKTVAVYPRFLRQNAKIDRMGGTPYPNKIGFIKMVRMLSNIRADGHGWGLADAKIFVESLPKDFRMFYFTSLGDAQTSRFMKHCQEMLIDVEWVLLDTTEGLINYDDHPGKDTY
jgi:hypothetical protein